MEGHGFPSDWARARRDSARKPSPWVTIIEICYWNGKGDMTKARARQRAKAKAAQKAKKREANADRPGQETHPGQFNPGASSIKSPRVNAGARNFAGETRRGAVEIGRAIEHPSQSPCL